MSLSQEQEVPIRNLIDGARKTFQNASELFAEAEILGSHNAMPRAYFLHQISLEDCGKLDMIVSAITSLLMGYAVNMKTLAKSFTKHDKKNRTNAYFLPQSVEEVMARGGGDIGATLEAFDMLQNEFHATSNRKKNEALYGKFNGSFFSPRDLIAKDDLMLIVERNTHFLEMGRQKIESLNRWEANLAKMAASFKSLREELELAKSKGNVQNVQDLERLLVNIVSSLVDERSTGKR